MKLNGRDTTELEIIPMSHNSWPLFQALSKTLLEQSSGMSVSTTGEEADPAELLFNLFFWLNPSLENVTILGRHCHYCKITRYYCLMWYKQDSWHPW